jgi:hypothetical protein
VLDLRGVRNVNRANVNAELKPGTLDRLLCLCPERIARVVNGSNAGDRRRSHPRPLRDFIKVIPGVAIAWPMALHADASTKSRTGQARSRNARLRDCRAIK